MGKRKVELQFTAGELNQMMQYMCDIELKYGCDMGKIFWRRHENIIAQIESAQRQVAPEVPILRRKNTQINR